MNFTQKELMLISDALIAAISANNEAAKLTTSRAAVEDMRIDNDLLCAVNRKVCGMVEDEEQRTASPDILIRVYGGLVQKVYCTVPGATVDIFDEDCDNDDDERPAIHREHYDRCVNSRDYYDVY